MNFLNPTLALVGLACVAIPIAIHLLMRRRRKPVMWAAMRFLMEAYRQQRRRLRLEQLLLLSARCLLIALVALALGRPFFGDAAGFGGRGAMTLYLLVDNGIASTARADDGSTALERHSETASSLLAQLDPAAGDRAALILLGGPAQPSVLPPTAETASLRDLLRNVEPTDSATDLPGGFAAVASDLAGQRGTPRVAIVILSDFLDGSADPEQTLTQMTAALGEEARDRVIVLASPPAEQGADNIAIAGVEPLRPVIVAPQRQGAAAAQSAPVRVLLRRTGPRTDEPAVSTVRLALETERGESIPAGQAAVRWSPGQREATASVLLEPPARALANIGPRGSASLIVAAMIDDDAIAGDNSWRRPIEIRRILRTGLIAPRRAAGPVAGPRGLDQFTPADWFRLALSPIEDGPRGREGLEPEIEIVEIEPHTLDAARLAGLDAAIITRPDLLPDPAWPRLRAFADAGGMIVVMPPPGDQVHLWPDAMVRELGLAWSIARESRQHDPDATIAADRAQGSPSVSRDADLLTLIRAELPTLAPPVRVQRTLPVEVPPGSGATLLELHDGSPLVIAAPPGLHGEDDADADLQPRGLVVFIATAFGFEWTDLQARPLMVPLAQEIIRQGIGRALGAQMHLAGTAPQVPARTVELRSMGDDGSILRTTPDAPLVDAPIRRAGLWQALDERSASRGIIAINADPAGSRTDPNAPQAIQDWLASSMPGGEVHWLGKDERPGVLTGGDASLHAIFDRRADDARLALPLLLAALCIALAELGMARWFTYGTARPSQGIPEPKG